jgi:hypothetical protein
MQKENSQEGLELEEENEASGPVWWYGGWYMPLIPAQRGRSEPLRALRSKRTENSRPS